jgi:hypothetical protein
LIIIFFGGLANQDQSSVPGVLAVRHDLGCAQNRRHVQIVAARMHHGDVLPSVVFGVYLTGVGQAGFFLNRQGVQFSAQHDGWARTIFQNGDDPSPANVLSDVIAGAAQVSGQLLGSLRFMGGKFGMLVQIEIECVSVGINSIHFFGSRSLSNRYSAKETNL